MRIKYITENGINYMVRVWDDWGRIWYLGNILHREDGPAIEIRSRNDEWWLADKRCTKQEHQSEIQKVYKFYKTCSVGDIIPKNLILLGKRDGSLGKIFKVYDIKEKKVYEKLVFYLVY